MSESDHEEEHSQESAPSPAEDRHSHVSVPSPAYSNADSATDTKSLLDSKTDLKRSRKSYQWIRRTANKELMDEKNEKLEEKANFSLKVSNLPVNWSFDVIKDVVFENYGPVNYIYMAADDEMCFVGMVKLEFVNFGDCQKAWENLHGRKVDDIRLFAEMRDTDEESDDESTPAKKKRLNKNPWRPDLDVWDIDPKGMYGLTLEYLTSLGIKPPIDRWVYVTNFRCDKSELKEVMELAGQVLLCTVDHLKIQKLGKVMYSHPLEAVQAVSMLNNQCFYGQPLKITIESCPVGTTFIPKGLNKIGPGLGVEGKPLRDIVKQYERYVKFQSSYVNPEIFRDPEVLFSFKGDESEINIPNQLLKLRNNSMSLQRLNLELNRNRSLSPNVRYKIEGPRDDPERISSPSSHRSIGQMGGSIPISKSCQSLGSSGWANGAGPLSGPGPNNSKPICHPGSMGGMGGSVPMGGPGLGPMGGPGPMGNQGPTGPVSGTRPMGGPGAMCGPGPTNNRGPLLGPGPVGGTGPMGGPRPMGGPGPMNPGVMGIRTPLLGPGPIMGNQGPMVGPVPMSGGPTCGPGPMGGGPMGGAGPMGSGGPMGGPGPVCNQGPIRGPGPPGPVSPGVAVELCNLPLSTTFPLLCEKMAECGNVMSLQLTSPGCAVVQFAQRIHAESCFRQYNGRHILGNMIEVKYL
ncbi:hypothetical protein O0L34_g15505 [Tuta absoluta]|nr:hypothetical protein O0L34_g15505 [Tuta absoluta]